MFILEGMKDFQYDNNNIVRTLRSLMYHFEDINNFFKTNYTDYYIYFLDGDNWGQRDLWKNEGKYDIETMFKLLNLTEYKDTLFMSADEFVLFSNKDLDIEIKEISKSLGENGFTVIKVKNPAFEGEAAKFIKDMFRLVNKYKYTLGKGEIYDMEANTN